jgi:hypothetical protein
MSLRRDGFVIQYQYIERLIEEFYFGMLVGSGFKIRIKKPCEFPFGYAALIAKKYSRTAGLVSVS